MKLVKVLALFPLLSLSLLTVAQDSQRNATLQSNVGENTLNAFYQDQSPRLHQDLGPDEQQWLNASYSLEYLSLRDFHLDQLPAELGDLTHLRVLDLGHNDFESLPSSMVQLQNLEEIYLDYDPNLDLDQAFSILEQLPNLRILHLDGSTGLQLPSSVGKLKGLQILTLRDHRLDTLPQELFTLNRLRVLDLGGNNFTTLPPGLSNLTSLEEIYLDGDPYLDIPGTMQTLQKLKRLKSLHLSNVPKVGLTSNRLPQASTTELVSNTVLLPNKASWIGKNEGWWQPLPPSDEFNIRLPSGPPCGPGVELLLNNLW